MATNGVVSYAVDADQGLLPSPAFVRAARDHGATFVRLRWAADAHNVLPDDLLVESVRRYRAGGLRVGLVADIDFNRPWLERPVPRAMYPNEPLGYNGNLRQNRLIKDSGVRIAQHGPRLVAAGAEAVWLGNEDNLVPLTMGQNVPPSADDKGTATAPEVALSRWYELAGYARKAGFTEVYSASLSLLPFTGLPGRDKLLLDPANPYLGKWLRTGVQYLRRTGVSHLPLDAISLNSEGWWSAAHAAAAARAVRDGLAPLATPGTVWPLVLGEWGTKNGQLVGNEQAALDTYAAWAAQVELLCFFELPVREPHAIGDFGLTDWVVQGGQFYPTTIAGVCPWSPVLKRCHGVLI